MRPIVNPQYRLLAIGTKEFPMDHLLLKKKKLLMASIHLSHIFTVKLRDL